MSAKLKIYISVLCLLAAASAYCGSVWTLDSTDAQLWSARPTWLGTPSRDYTHNTVEGVRFTVNELLRGMKWVHYPAIEIDPEIPHYLKIVYKAHNIRVYQDYGFLVDSSGQNLATIELSDIIDDGCRHCEIIEMPPDARINTIAVQCQSDKSGAYMEIVSLSVFDSMPEKNVSDEVELSPGASDPLYSFVPFETNQTAASWLELAGYSQDFESAQVTVSGVPFNVSGNPLSVFATALEDTETLNVDINDSPGAVYVLMGARFTGEEWASIGYGDRNNIAQPDQMRLELVYSDGSVERCLPARVQSGIHRISKGLGVYYINTRPGGQVESIRFIDNIRNGQLAVFAVTSGPAMPEKSEPGRTSPQKSFDAASGPLNVSNDKLAISYDSGGQVYSIANKLTNTQWLSSACSIYQVEEVEGLPQAELTANALPSGQIGFTLKLTNNTSRKVRCNVKFPVISNINPGGDSTSLGYCFPLRSPIINNENTYIRGDYSGYVPFQFIDVFYPGSGGLYINTNDSENWAKNFWLDKLNEIEMGCEYVELELGADSELVLPQAIIGAHTGDWHSALEEYKETMHEWYSPAAPRKQWFREVFNFRQQFLHFGWPVETGAFNKETKELCLWEMVQADIEAFGGVDYLHLFDWGWTPSYEMYGDYAPWSYLGGHEQFRSEIQSLQNNDIPVGLYFQGYLTSLNSMISRSKGREFQILNADGFNIDAFGSRYKMCPLSKGWQDHLLCSVLNANDLLGINGVYLDSFGFGPSSYKCYNPLHHHPLPSNPARAEAVLTKIIRTSRLPRESVVYTESMPVDVGTQYQDGSFTTAIRQTRFQDSYGYLSIGRFILPEFKMFEILVVDRPIMDDFEGVKLVFYNGQGIWLMGGAGEWFSPELRVVIQKCHSILTQHSDAFTSDSPVPLVPTLDPELYCNFFPSEDKHVWTFFNSGFEHIRGEALEVEHIDGSTYYDLWNERPITPRIEGNKAFINLNIGPRDVGCIVRNF
ncbi:hypothetical protein SMSP2_01404 [Limihaloglobus sulfuriphilus]|uniref:DUF6259 domain-containing protein n=1 Tax=Limihaloglobus sulfuriphilus TaxID=1851148 RepID=A0A1Q2MEE5_9BACT|nr:DUF6259 domain-containing protein [Limihaloglobus sulfuriphilus]AQQ71040.1 hypothetical protein SMSP2_01404 [Limihaloglobus sulfuriphilus]